MLVTARFLSLCLLSAALSSGQPTPLPKIGIIDYFGLKKANRERIDKALGVKIGDPLPKSKGEIELQIELVNGVVRASLEAVCCANGEAILYVGILEKGAPVFEYRDAPSDETVKLPEPLVDTWNRFMEQLRIAVREDKAAEDLTNGHSLMQYAPAREEQLKFPDMVDANLPLIRAVLRKSVDETERAIAAFVIAYATKKPAVIDDLQFAIQDPDDGVRNNAMRSLASLAVLGKLKPELNIRIPATWFVEQMNSIIWSDRNKAAYALVPITEDRNAGTLAMLKDRALDSMVDMARWKSPGHALQGFILLARTAGWEEKRIQETWAAGTHLPAIEEILKAFEAAGKKKKG